MVRLQHVSFKDWNPIGKPRKKPTEKSADPFGVAATLELTHNYVKDNNNTKQYNTDK